MKIGEIYGSKYSERFCVFGELVDIRVKGRIKLYILNLGSHELPCFKTELIKTKSIKNEILLSN